MDWFNVICGILTIISTVITVVLLFKQSDLKKSLESQLISLIQNNDLLCHNASDPHVSKSEIHHQAVIIRNQAIGILKMFSKKEERFKTFDFGLSGDNIEERIKQRKEALGIDFDGCIIPQQAINRRNDMIDISSAEAGDMIDSYNCQDSTIDNSEIISIRMFPIHNYICINDELCLTANHKIYTRHSSWMSCHRLSIGDELLQHDGEYKMVVSLKYIQKNTESYSVKVKPNNNLYINSYLVHNDEEEK